MIPVDWTSLFEPSPVASRAYEASHVAALRNTRHVRIEWGDCDPAGIIFYPRYFAMFDASVALLFERALGMTKIKQFKEFDFVGYPLVKTRARFLKPTRFGDDVMIESAISFGRASFDIEHKVILHGDPCVECAETRVWVVRDEVTGDIKSHAVPQAVLEKFGQ